MENQVIAQRMEMLMQGIMLTMVPLTEIPCLSRRIIDRDDMVQRIVNFLACGVPAVRIFTGDGQFQAWASEVEQLENILAMLETENFTYRVEKKQVPDDKHKRGHWSALVTRQTKQTSPSA